MIEREIESPIPIPWRLVVKSGLKMRSTFSGATPVPVSFTETITPPDVWISEVTPSARASSVVAIDSIAFVVKFRSTCWSCTRSPFTRGRESESST